MGLIVHVYRSAEPDCSLNGISAQVDLLTVVNVSGPFEPTADRPAVLLIDHPAGPQYGQLIVPAVKDGESWVPVRIPGTNRTFGGNYATTSDSRWWTGQPISIHDRFEGPR